MAQQGRAYLSIPGPSVMPDRVLAAMQRAAPNIYHGALPEMVAGLIPDLRAVAQTTTAHVALYTSNGHGLWEAALTNLFSRGDKVLVLATGRFAEGWGNYARALGLEVEQIDFGKQGHVQAERVTAALDADRARRIRAILVVQVDTASSVRNDIAELRRAIDATGHPALLMVDCIASLGCDMFHMDAWGVDLVLAASQKGLMTPPGLGFVWFNDRVLEEGREAGLRTPFWDWRPRIAAEEFYQYFGGTAPTHHLFALREALNMLVHEEGLGAAWARHGRLARAVWAAVEAWGRVEGGMALNIADPGRRAHAVTSVSMPPPGATAIRDWVERHAEVTLGIGLGMAPPGDPAWHGFFRIAHMGHVNAHMVMGALGAIDAALKALDLPHGAGALEAASAAIARP